MQEFSLGDWKENSVGVFVDGPFVGPVARIVNPNWPTQEQIPQQLLKAVRHSARLFAAACALMREIRMLGLDDASGEAFADFRNRVDDLDTAIADIAPYKEAT